MSEPAFYVEVVLGGYPEQPLDWRYPRLTWHCEGGFSSGGMRSTVTQRAEKLGRFACHRVDSVGVAVPLLEPVVELSIESAGQILEAIDTGYITPEAVAELRQAYHDTASRLKGVR